jgi:DNA-binding HxlR family transcriptional regulator
MAAKKPIGETFCPADSFQRMISGKYKLRILWGLRKGARRFGQIRKGLLRGSAGTGEVAPRVLSRELKILAEMRMIQRTDYGVVPAKVEYKLTTKGRSFIPVISVIKKWGAEQMTPPAAGLKSKRGSEPLRRD